MNHKGITKILRSLDDKFERFCLMIYYDHQSDEPIGLPFYRHYFLTISENGKEYPQHQSYDLSMYISLEEMRTKILITRTAEDLMEL